MTDEDKVASMDIHKKVLMVVVGSREGGRDSLAGGAGASALRDRNERTTPLIGLAAGTGGEGSGHGVHRRVLEAGLDGAGTIHVFTLGASFSNRAPKGRKNDFRDAERLRRRSGDPHDPN